MRKILFAFMCFQIIGLGACAGHRSIASEVKTAEPATAPTQEKAVPSFRPEKINDKNLIALTTSFLSRAKAKNVDYSVGTEEQGYISYATRIRCTKKVGSPAGFVCTALTVPESHAELSIGQQDFKLKDSLQTFLSSDKKYSEPISITEMKYEAIIRCKVPADKNQTNIKPTSCTAQAPVK